MVLFLVQTLVEQDRAAGWWAAAVEGAGSVGGGAARRAGNRRRGLDQRSAAADARAGQS